MAGFGSLSRFALSAVLVVYCFVSLSVTANDDSGLQGDQQPVVKTAKATLRGRRFEVRSKQVPGFERTVDVYSRLPYAEPPVGDLRYARPVPKSIEGDFDATRDPLGCAQVKSPFFVLDLPFSEDCLYLDVTVPQPQPENGAVMVWIHGGGYHVGAARSSDKDTLFYVARADVILVTLNYRLGMLGFMTTGDDAMPGNLGLLDQRQALLWVQTNIAAFGGDPSRVTIFGESAGSGSVNLHLLSTMSAGLFSGAIMQSGALAMWTHHPDKQTAVDMTNAFAMELGCDVTSSGELVTCLRGKSVEEMQEVQLNVTMDLARYMVSPVPDGEFLLKDPFLLAAEGSFNPANIMLGCLSEEGNMATIPVMFGQEGTGKAVVNEEAYRGYMTNVMQMPDPVVQDMVIVAMGSDEMFSSPEPDYSEVAAGILGDSMFVCPAFSLAQQIAQAGRNVFAYFMTHQASHSIWGKNMTGYGATHGEDLQYIFGTPFLHEDEADDEDNDYYMVGRFNEEEIGLSLQMIKYWSNFGKTGIMYRSKGGHSSRKAGRSESLFCNYPHRICMQDRYEGYEYCMNHILEDKSSPFKQCNFVSTKTGQKCHKPAPKADRKEGYCPAHARKASQMRHKAALKAKPTDAVKDTLDELDYYRPASIKSVPEVPASLATKILDYGSESESEGDPLLLEQGWRGTTDSDAESVDSEQEDALKYAGVYTAEEAALITRDKLIRLQSLYINQFKKLQHVMKEKRRSYLVALRQEREAFGIDFGVITDPKQKRKFREYQAARGFRRRRGKEALLYQKSKQRRIQATADYQGKRNVPLMLQCCHKSCEGEQCSMLSLPLAKFCKDHILMDPKQVLYSECSKGGKVCDKPASPMSPDESCLLHMGLPQHKPFKPYEPEPPPPPPQPKAPPPPTIIPLPEAMLPPAPILPSQLDSQIDQLLQFQPHFLEQQLQQHVYDASQYMGSFAPPDVDVDSQREAPSASPAKQGKNIEDELDDDANTPGEIQGNPSEEQSDAKPDAQTDVHVDVETDSDVLLPVVEPQQEPNCDKPAAQQSNHVESPTLPKAEDVKDAMNTQPIVETVHQPSPVNAGGSEKSSLCGVADTMALPEGKTQPAYELDASSMVRSGSSANISADEKMDEETALTVHRATGDHNYNQQPFDMSESADPIIDVT